MSPTSSAASKPTQGDPHIGRSRLKSSTCKTCSSCRQKKIKCSGIRPHCNECTANGLDCTYPRDARREPRPPRALYHALEATMTAMLDHLKATGTTSLALEETMRANNFALNHESAIPQQDTDEHAPATPESAISGPLPTPAASAITYETPNTITPQNDMPMHDFAASCNQSIGPGPELGFQHQPHFDQPSGTTPARPVQNATVAVTEDPHTGLSPCEARVAGVFHEHGCVSSVHGLAGIMNPTRRALHKQNISKVYRRGESAVSGSKARLISNAILQKQSENRMFRQPQQSIDLDGCEPELARHLISLHFNQIRCATYRPAIMESISTGGPWVNKLLLNAIYYSSSLHSDRPEVRAPNNDHERAGSRFYERFSVLLINAMGKPSIPSAVALLLTSSTLVAQGNVSAGWALSGTAYRMIIELGCHMMLGPDYQEVQAESGTQMLQKDIEHEMRKRLYWGAYITDVIQSLYLGRQCTFATTEARVPLQYLDTFEELEDWQPYVDPTQSISIPPPYNPQPAYTVSTLTATVRLMQIGALVSDLYGISTVSYQTDVVLRKKTTIESQLNNWITTLPDHFMFDPDGSQIPPPHQITPITTYHTLRILLYRAFIEEGHLRRHSDAEAKRLSEQECITSALVIEKHIRAYRRTFTLRRAPFLLSYAIYSAVAIILPQERHDRGHFTDLIAFFWTCLGELQHGCNSGLKKPLSVLREMAREFQLSSKERAPANTAQSDFSSLDESFFPQLPLGPLDVDRGIYSEPTYVDNMSVHNHMDPYNTGDMPAPRLMNFLNDQEWDLSQNTLYGLFAPTQSYQ
ncbi:hypothetical protein IQ07DRAFT_546298 [Pyrenochaeta sp. DS3sAY3a]|nr:hypothetical protein IQ07DRAFT_546298 [Pyrenochaeta sp. DS3sAY3a]